MIVRFGSTGLISNFHSLRTRRVTSARVPEWRRSSYLRRPGDICMPVVVVVRYRRDRHCPSSKQKRDVIRNTKTRKHEKRLSFYHRINEFNIFGINTNGLLRPNKLFLYPISFSFKTRARTMSVQINERIQRTALLLQNPLNTRASYTRLRANPKRSFN